MPTGAENSGLTGLLVVIVACTSLSCMLWAVMSIVRGQRLLPEAQPKEIPWGAGSIWVIFLLWLLMSVLAGAVVNEAIRGDLPPTPKPKADASVTDPEWLPIWQIASTTLANGLLLFLLPAWLRATVGAKAEQLGLTTRDFGRNAARGALGCLIILPLVYGIQILALQLWPVNAHPMQGMLEFNGSPAIMLLATVAGVFLAPAVEELMFRGVLQGWLSRVTRDWANRLSPGEPPSQTHEAAGEVAAGLDEPVPPPEPIGRPPGHAALKKTGRGISREARLRFAAIAPNLFASLIFAGIHRQQWPAPLALFPLSLALGWVYERTGSLVAPIVLHGTFNAVSTVLLFSTLG